MTSEELKLHHKEMVEQGLFPSIQFEPETLRLKTDRFYINLTDVNIRLDDRNSFTFFVGNAPVGWLTLKYPIKDDLCKAVFNWLIDIQRWVDKVNLSDNITFIPIKNNNQTVVVDISQISLYTTNDAGGTYNILIQTKDMPITRIISYNNKEHMEDDFHRLNQLISQMNDKKYRKNYSNVPSTFFYLE